MIETLDLHDRLRSLRTSVVTSPLAERPFVHVLTRNRFGFDNDLGGRRNRQARVFASDDGHGRALQPADPVVFGDAAREFDSAREIDERVLSERDGDFARFAFRTIFLANDAPLLAGRDVES